MNYILPVAVCLLIVALVVFITIKMVGRQQTALASEKKAIPPKIAIFLAGMFTTLFFTFAIIAALLIMFAPFVNISFAGTKDNTTTVLFVILFAAAGIGTSSYWLFVRLGFFSWKVFSLD